VDEDLLNADDLSSNKRHAVIVRVGEKRILIGALQKMQLLLLNVQDDKEERQNSKRKGSEVDSPSTKKTRHVFR
jgi:N-lysine methyltransferase SETD6